MTRSGTSILAIGFLLGSLAACSAGPQPARAPRPLPPDSAALLRNALKLAKPEFATQSEALRSGIYESGRLAHQRVAPPAVLPRTAAGGNALFLIQLAAYRDRGIAEQSARQAEKQFPGRPVVIEQAGDLFRVALAGWDSLPDAEAELTAVRRHYADAWIRTRRIP